MDYLCVIFLITCQQQQQRPRLSLHIHYPKSCFVFKIGEEIIDEIAIGLEYNFRITIDSNYLEDDYTFQISNLILHHVSV